MVAGPGRKQGALGSLHDTIGLGGIIHVCRGRSTKIFVFCGLSGRRSGDNAGASLHFRFRCYVSANNRMRNEGLSIGVSSPIEHTHNFECKTAHGNKNPSQSQNPTFCTGLHICRCYSCHYSVFLSLKQARPEVCMSCKQSAVLLFCCLVFAGVLNDVAFTNFRHLHQECLKYSEG